jgi:hypothetical protein
VAVSETESPKGAHENEKWGGYIVNRFTVILKSGKEFSFYALEVEVDYKADSNHRRTIEEVERVRWYGASGKIPLYINPTEVAAIYYEKLDENNGGDTVT